MRCPKCGQENPLMAQFCGFCGAPLSGATGPEITSGQQIRTLEGHAGWVNSVVFSPDGRTLASGSSDGTVILWGVR